MLYHVWERYRLFIVASVIFLFLSLSYLFYPGTSTIEPSIPFQTPVYASEQTTVSSTQHKQVNQALDSTVPSTQPVNSSEAAKKLYVDVKGKVKQPGIYSFSPNERVYHIISRAGGLLQDADRNRINLAMLLTDGMVVWIPSAADKTSMSTTSTTPLATPCSEVQAISSSLHPTSTSSSSNKINLNTATLDQLLSLPGVGEAKAKAILSYREKKGGFSSVQQLLEVTGIGEKMFEKIKEKVSI